LDVQSLPIGVMGVFDSRKLLGVTPVKCASLKTSSSVALQPDLAIRPEWRCLSTGGCQAPSIREALERLLGVLLVTYC
jgi:hypothetical protein